MMQNYSFHTHTNFSDGRNSIEEMLQQATALGWSKIGISDHLVVHKNIKQSPSWPLMSADRNQSIYRETFEDAAKAFAEHRDKVRRIAEKYPLEVFVGAEVDFFTYPGWQSGFEEFMKKAQLDYYITGNHYLQMEEQIVDERNVAKLPSPILATGLRQHFVSIRQAVESGYFLFLAHLDYIRLSGCCSVDSCWEEKMAVVEALQHCNLPTEINTKGLRRSHDFHPEQKLLNLIMQRNIPLIISDDAHRPEELGFSFDKAETTLVGKGYKNRFCGLNR